MPKDHLHWHHVRSHTGLIFNEFVDLAAKREAAQSFHHPRQRISMQRWHSIIPHLWLIFAGPRWGMPLWKNGGFEIPPPDMPAQLRKEADQPIRTVQHKHIKLAISLATANVQSLSRHPEGHAGKLHFLQRQMREFQLNFIGIQEARTEQGVACRGNILRLCSGHQQHHLGVELWIDLDMPIGFDTKKKPYKLQRSDIQAVHVDPRRLLARVEHAAWTAWVGVLHVPHSGHTQQARADWWHKTQDLFDRCKTNDPLFILMDANAPPGEADGHAVLRQGFATTQSTKYMRDFLAINHLCLPATSTCHFGEQGTWLDLRGERLHCIHHVAIPEEWLHCATHSQVLEEFDLATSKDDHRLVAIQLQWNDLVEIVKFQKRARRVVQIDYKRADITDMIRNYQPASWTADIEQHTEAFNQHLHLAMQLGEQPNVSQIKKHYIDEEAWNTRKIKLKHRATLKALRTRIAHDLLRRCFDAWRAKNSDLFTEGTCYTTMLHCWNFKHWIAFRRAAQKLKQQLCHAKQCKLQCVLDDMNAETAASEILRHLRSFTGPTNPKKLKQKTLPLVHDAEGNVCVHPAEALGVWVDFFMQMEGGHRTSLPQLRAEWIEELSQFANAEINIDISEVPTLTDLEISYRRVPCGRAQGPDGIPGELCHYQPASIAKASYSQLAKLVCHGQEFLWHKGGQLTPAYKGKGPTSSCTSYRSLLVSSSIGKALHRTIRQSSASLYENFLQAQQVGGRRKIPVQLALHQVRAHMRRAAYQGRSAGVLFLDLTEAFYRITREITIGGTPTDELLAHAMHRLNLPPSALHDIRALLNEPSALQQAGLSVTAQRCIQSIHTGTFFWLAGQHDAAKTSMGTRPGDCFADIVFGYAWGIVLKKMEAFMVEHDLVDKLPAADCPNFDAVWSRLMDDVYYKRQGTIACGNHEIIQAPHSLET